MSRIVTVVFGDDQEAEWFATALVRGDAARSVVAVKLERGWEWGATEFRAGDRIAAGQVVEEMLPGLVRQHRRGRVLGTAVTEAACNGRVYIQRAPLVPGEDGAGAGDSPRPGSTIPDFT